MKAVGKISLFLAVLLVLPVGFKVKAQEAFPNAHFVGFRVTTDPGQPSYGKLSYGTALHLEGKLYSFTYLNVGEGASSVSVEAAVLWPIGEQLKLGLVAGTGADWVDGLDPVAYGQGSAGGLATYRFKPDGLWGAWAFGKRKDDLKSSTFYQGRFELGVGLFRRF